MSSDKFVVVAVNVDKECFSLVVAVVNAYERDESAAVLDKIPPDPVFLRVVLERVCLEVFNLLRSSEVWDLEAGGDLAQDFAVGVQIARIEVHMPRPVHLLPLLTVVEKDTPRRTGARAGGVRLGVWFEERPQQVIRDLLLREKGRQLFGGWLKGGVDVVHKEVQVPSPCGVLGVV